MSSHGPAKSTSSALPSKRGPAMNNETGKKKGSKEKQVEEYYEGKRDYHVEQMNRLLKDQQKDRATFDQHKAYGNMSVAANVLQVTRKIRLVNKPDEKPRKRLERIPSQQPDDIAEPKPVPTRKPPPRIISQPGTSKEDEVKKETVPDRDESPPPPPPPSQPEEEETSSSEDELDLIELMYSAMKKEHEMKTREYAKRLCDVINHQTVQDRMKEMIDVNNQKISDIYRRIDSTIENSGTVTGILGEVQKIVDEINALENPGNIFELIFGTDLMGVLNDKQLWFISNDNLDADARAKAFIELMNRQARSLHDETVQSKKFECYMGEWKENRLKWLEMEKMPEDDQKRREYEKRKAEFKKTIEEQEQQMKKAYKDQKINNFKCFDFAVVEPANVATVVESHDSCLPCLRKSGKVDVVDSQTDMQNRELKNIRENFQNWGEKLKKGKLQNYLKKNMRVNANCMIKEIDRIYAFNGAVLLKNEAKYEQDHTQYLRQTIEEARKVDTDEGFTVMPMISYGQLPPANEGHPRKVRAEFYFASSVSEAGMKAAEKQLDDIFVNNDSEKFEVNEREKGKLIAEITSSGNITATIAGSISQIANCRVTAAHIGDFGPNKFPALNPHFNRIFSKNKVDKAEGFIPTYFRDPILHGRDPYFCPNGWRKFAVEVGMDETEFERKYDAWPVAYHGTDSSLAMTILSNGLKASGQGCYLDNDEETQKGSTGAVYVSPSIEYSGHPRYASVRKIKNKFVQMALQVRVRPYLKFKRKAGTLPGAYPEDSNCDPNFDNGDLEWIIRWPPGKMMTQNEGIIVHGLMFRVTDKHPIYLPHNKWWGKPGEYWWCP